MKVSLSSYFDPWSKEHHGLKNFKVIPRFQQVAAVIFTALAGAVSFGILSLPVFRLLTNSNVPTKALASRVGKVWTNIMHPLKKADPLDSKGRTPLHYAIFEGDLSRIQSLVESGADINKKDHLGYTPLNFAVMDKNIEIFNFLIEMGGDINSKNHLGLSLLAIEINRSEPSEQIIQMLLEKGASLENCDSKGTSALHFASMRGDIEVVAMLLQAGASPDLCDRSGMSPLALARIKRVENYEAIKELFLSVSPSSISYENEFMHRHLIGHAFSLSGTTKFLPKIGNTIRQAPAESSIPIPLFWEEIEESFDEIAKGRPDLLDNRTRKVLIEALEFAKNPHSPLELYQRWKENRPVFIETGYHDHFAAALLYKDHLILVNRGGGNEGKRVRVVKIRKERITEETIKSIKDLTKNEALDYVKFMHQEFPMNYSFKQTSFEKELETTSNQFINHQTANNCAFANREGAAIVLSQMLGESKEPFKESSFIALPLLQKCYFAENYLETISHQDHAYYPSPLLLAEMSLHLHQEVNKIASDPQTKKKVEESIKNIEVALTALQKIPVDSMPTEIKAEWKKELRKAREILSR